MATLSGGTYRNPRTGRAESARVSAPVAKMYEYATRSGKDAYRCLGVVGNTSHLLARTPGDHTWFSKHSTFRKPGGPTVYPKRGWIYAGDWIVPEMAKFERWLLARLRAGYYTRLIKYFNILNRHWNRKAMRGGKMFAYANYSPDHHFHCSWMPGAEFAIVDLFADYEHFRDIGRNRLPSPAARPESKAPAKPAGPDPVDAAVRKLPAIRRGMKNRAVGICQAALVAHVYWPSAAIDRWIDRDFGPGTEAKVKTFQEAKGLKVTGVVDTATWDALLPDAPPTVQRGSDGFYVRMAQCLLYAWGQNPGRVDSKAGDKFVAALQRFQAARKVRNSVVKGRGDGIGGRNTWVAFFTL